MGFEKVLLSLDPTEQKSFLSIGVDFIIVNDKTIHLKGNILFHRCNYPFHLKLTEEKRRVFISPRRYHSPSSLCCGLAMIVTRVTRQVPLAEQELPDCFTGGSE